MQLSRKIDHNNRMFFRKYPLLQNETGNPLSQTAMLPDFLHMLTCQGNCKFHRIVTSETVNKGSIAHQLPPHTGLPHKPHPQRVS